MIRMQIVERPGADLFRVLKRAIRSKELRTFALEKHGTRVVHVSAPGFMNWTATPGIIACEIRPGLRRGDNSEKAKEWQFLSNLVGRLADRYPALVESVNIQLEAPPPPPASRKRRRK